MNNQGKLYICGTPIGNLEDITLRALKILKEVDLIAAEDTRRTGKLLEHFEIEASLTSYHEHNEQEKAPELIRFMQKGKELALTSDAGMPGISDPGQILINQAIAAGIEVLPIPGPTAAISALVVSGLSMDRFMFEGFIPRQGQARQTFKQRLGQATYTVIFYESPYRLKQTLEELASILGERSLAVIREISKLHEEKIYGTAEEILHKLGNREIKGEIVVVVQGRQKARVEQEGWEELSLREHIELLMENGYTKKKAIKKVASLRELPKREVYREAIPIPAQYGDPD